MRNTPNVEPPTRLINGIYRKWIFLKTINAIIPVSSGRGLLLSARKNNVFWFNFGILRDAHAITIIDRMSIRNKSITPPYCPYAVLLFHVFIHIQSHERRYEKQNNEPVHIVHWYFYLWNRFKNREDEQA